MKIRTQEKLINLHHLHLQGYTKRLLKDKHQKSHLKELSLCMKYPLKNHHSKEILKNTHLENSLENQYIKSSFQTCKNVAISHETT